MTNGAYAIQKNSGQASNVNTNYPVIPQKSQLYTAFGEIDLDEAQRFLKTLDPNATAFCFQIFDDTKQTKHAEHRTGAFADLAPWLIDENRKGHGVFVTVNATDGRGRKIENITRVRAAFRELDAPTRYDGLIWLNPSMIVESSPGKRHEYFLCREDDPLTYAEFEGVERFLSDVTGSDPNARDLSRVLRLPGFFHQKGEPFRTRLVSVQDWRYSRAEILRAFPPILRPKANGAQIEGDVEHTPAAEALVRSIIAAIPGEKIELYCDWLRFGFALARLGDDWQTDEGFDLRLELWEELSAKAPSYRGGQTGCVDKWSEILCDANRDDHQATIRNLLHTARESGWHFGAADIAPEMEWEALKAYYKITGRWDAAEDLNAAMAKIFDEEERERRQPASGEDSAAIKGPTRKMRRERFRDAVGMATAESSRPLIDGLLDEGAFSVIYGDSNAGKTFTALDKAFSVATGAPWNGRRTRRGLVVYVAAEGGARITRRLAALDKRPKEQLAEDAREPLFDLIRHPIDLRSSNADLNELVKLIREAEAEYGEKCAWVIVDTLSRALAGGDENSSVDMGGIVTAADRIRAATGAHLSYIHHSGKDAARGARGHSLLRAATDTEIEVTPKKIEVTKQRDLETGYKAGFKLVDVPLGHDPDGALIKSAVVEWETPFEASGSTKKVRAKKIPDGMKMLLEVLNEALAAEGVVIGEDADSKLAVQEDVVRERYFARLAEKAKPGEDPSKLFDRQRMAFKRSVRGAIERNIIMAREHGDDRYLWIRAEPSPEAIERGTLH